MEVDQEKLINLLKRNHLFRGIDNTRLERVAEDFEKTEVAAGHTVFDFADDTDFFYFIYNGRVKVSYFSPKTRQVVQIGYLEESDYFGQELLVDGWPRQLRIEAETDVILLKLDRPKFIAIVEVIPSLSPRLQFVLDTYRLMLVSRFPWIEPQEFVYYISRRHPYFLLLRMLAPFFFGFFSITTLLVLASYIPLTTTITIMIVIAAIITVGWLAWDYIDWANDYYIITNRRVVYQERMLLLYDSRQESPTSAIQSTASSTSLIGRWLGYGNVAIRTYIGTIMFKAIILPDQVMAIVQEHQLRAQSGQRQDEKQAVEKLIEKSLGFGPPATAAQPKTVDTKRLSNLKLFITENMTLRFEKAGSIIYRTHWYILLKKILAPSLILLSLGFLLVLSVTGVFTLLSPLSTFSFVFVISLGVWAWWFYQFMDWHNDIYVISSDQIIDIDKKPLGDEHRNAAPVKNILSIEYKRLGIIGLILNYGTVYIRVGDKQLTFDNVYNPSKVQRELFDRVAAKNYAEKQAAQEAESQRMAEYLAAYHRVIQRGRPPQNPPTRGGF